MAELPRRENTRQWELPSHMVKEALRQPAQATKGQRRPSCPTPSLTYMVIIVIFVEASMTTIPKETWTVANAKARFSELIDKAKSEGPQTVTRNGKPAVVLVSVEEWEKKTARKGTLSEFFRNSPLYDSGIELVRLDHPPRKVDL
jgi:prevent-host-death family protein